MITTISKKTVFACMLTSTFLISSAFGEDTTSNSDVVTQKSVVEKDTAARVVYTLDQVLKKTLEVHPQVSSSQYTLEEAQALYEKAKRSSLLPKFDLGVYGGWVPDTPSNAGPAFNFPDTGLFDGGEWGPFIKIRLEAIQPIYTFGKIKHLQKAAQAGVKAGEQEINRSKNEVILQAKTAYFALVNLYSYQSFVRDLIDRSQKAADIVSKKLQKSSSDVTDIDLIRIEVFQAETKRREIEILHNIHFVKMTLKVLMSLPRDLEVDIADRKFRMDDFKVEDVAYFLEKAKKHRPEFKQLQYLVEAKESLKKEKRAQSLPSFGLAGEYEFGKAPGREDIDNPFLVNNFNNHSAGATLFLKQSLSFHTLDSDTKRARAALNKAKADRQRAYQGIEVQVRKAFEDVVSKKESFEHSKQSFKKVRSWVLATTLNFGVGVVPPKELVEAFVAYSKVRNEYLDTLFDYKMAVAKLEYATGDVL